jgi:hypothetical protein
MRFFNTAGPVNCQDHYCLPPLERFDLADIVRLIEQKKYFILHAPRQVGKTTYLLALMDYLNRTDRYRCLYFNVEVAQTAREDVGRGVKAILSELASMARDFLKDPFVEQVAWEVLANRGPDAAFNEVLTRWAEQSQQPLVLLIDEIDALVGDTLISVLRQLRAGYPKRPGLFPQSVILCGVRDVRDYRIYSAQEKAPITGGSAFNIKAESLRLGNFTRPETETLLQQHTAETGQQFESNALALIWQLTQGQPWLVNALAYEACFKMKAGRDRANSITSDMVIEAKEALILRRETHLDQLVHKLGEDRVQRVIGPMLEGVDLDRAVRQDDIQYVIDLGLVSRTKAGLQIANPIYREVIPRELSFITQVNFESSFQPARYIQTDSRLDMDNLLAAFQQFFRQHSEHWLERFDYKEARPQLLLQAFLQRIVNSGGRIEREYGLGRGRTDLLVIWPYEGGLQQVVIELKLLHHSLKRTLGEGLAQTWAYMDRCGTEAGHLVIFDRDKTRPWEEKIFQREEMYQGKKIAVWGM